MLGSKYRVIMTCNRTIVIMVRRLKKGNSSNASHITKRIKLFNLTLHIIDSMKIRFVTLRILKTQVETLVKIIQVCKAAVVLL